jgi:hypothetical protein
MDKAGIRLLIKQGNHGPLIQEVEELKMAVKDKGEKKRKKKSARKGGRKEKRKKRIKR